MINTKSMVKKPKELDDSMNVLPKLNKPNPMFFIAPKNELQVHENPPIVPKVPNKVIWLVCVLRYENCWTLKVNLAKLLSVLWPL